MATFLELVNDTERESGTVNVLTSATTDVTSPGTPRQAKIIEMVQEAYRLIQTDRMDWPWRQVEFSHALTIGQARYTAANLGISSFSRWMPDNDENAVYRVYDPAIGLSDQTKLCGMPFMEWRDSFDMGTDDQNRPYRIAFDTQNRLCVGQTPDKAYVLRGLYQRGVSTLIENDDEPILPVDHHMAIVWRALMLLHGHDEGQFALGNAAANYTASYRRLVNDSLPEVLL